MRLAASLFILALIAVFASASVFKAADYTRLFAQFTKTFSRQYAANAVRQKLNIFKANLDKITLINAKTPGALHVNGLTDMPASEFKKLLTFRAPASVYAAVKSIKQGKNRDGRNAALALLQAEENIHAPVNEEALAAVDAYAASFLDISSDADANADATPVVGNARNSRGSRNTSKAAAAQEEARRKAAADEAAKQAAAAAAAAEEAAKNAISPAEKAQLLAFADAGFDWRSRNVLGDARHQGGCGSCWSYGTIAAIEAGLAIKHKIPPPVLSEQHMIDCDSSNGGCNGGWYTSAFKFAADNGLRTTEAYGPYKIAQETCRQSSVAPYQYRIKGAKNVFGYSAIRNTADYHVKLVKAVKEEGPVAIAIWAPEYYQFWGKGIFMGVNCTGQEVANHAVVVVGFGFDREKNTRYWTLRNSFGRTWGDGTGHYRMERHDTENTCAYHVGAYLPDV